jgi:hypothetical protein
VSVTTLAGFELNGATDPMGASVGTASYSSGQVRTGAFAGRCNPASSATGWFAVPVTGIGNWIHFGLYIATMPTVSRSILGQSSANSLALNSTGTLSVKDGATVLGTSSVALVTGRWYWIGTHMVTGTSVLLQIDGVDQVSATYAVANVPARIGCADSEASAIDIYIDDLVADDAGFLASSKVNLALPISDNTVTGVTDNNGVTTNIWQCVDNIPPAGVASADEAANPKAGMHFTASVTDNYIANLTTYTTLGVGASDTVLAVQSIVRHGEDIATGTKNLQNVGALTNPTVAGASVTAGGGGGAHGAEVGLWVTTLGTLTTSPSVTVGTSPTIRTSRISESRLACVDFMGMYVAWTPAVVAAVALPQIRQLRQAVNRASTY